MSSRTSLILQSRVSLTSTCSIHHPRCIESSVDSRRVSISGRMLVSQTGLMFVPSLVEVSADFVSSLRSCLGSCGVVWYTGNAGTIMEVAAKNIPLGAIPDTPGDVEGKDKDVLDVEEGAFQPELSQEREVQAHSDAEIQDGGYGWVMVACIAAINATTWGMSIDPIARVRVRHTPDNRHEHDLRRVCIVLYPEQLLCRGVDLQLCLDRRLERGYSRQLWSARELVEQGHRAEADFDAG